MSFVKLPVLRHGLMVRDEEILPDRAVTDRVEKVRKLMGIRNLEALLVYSDPTKSGSACYLTNYPCFGLGRRATVVLTLKEGPFLFTAEPGRNLPRVRRFTTCDIEKTRQFMSAAVERVKKLSTGGPVGLVNFSNLPLGVVKDTKELSAMDVKDATEEFILLLAAKDESSLKATNRAVELAGKAIRSLSDRASPGKDLWQLAADVDYQLRLLGCEDTNVLMGCSAGGRVRPAYPARTRLSRGDTLVAYIAAQYARQWGVAGTTVSIGGTDDLLSRKLFALSEVQKKASLAMRPGTTLGQAKETILGVARQAGLTLAEDLPVVAGVGFDLCEYPMTAEDRVEENMVLQVALAVDFDEGFTGMIVTMARVTRGGAVWLTGAK